MDFLRVFQHLLPTGQAWRTTIVGKTLRKFFAGLAPAHGRVKDFADGVLLDAFPDTTRELAEWQNQFALVPSSNEANDRLALDAAWKATGGQSPAYIQGVLQAAGFDVFVHEWTADTTPPYTGVRNPLLYINQPFIGRYQCSGFSNQPQCFDGPGQPQCNDFAANQTNYLVNKDLTDRSPPRMPENNDEGLWEGIFYIGPETFPSDVAPHDGWAEVPASRKDELERLILQLRPLRYWIVMLVDWVPDGGGGAGGIFDATFGPEFN